MEQNKHLIKTFGENLRKFRAQRQLSQRALDAICGIDHGMISRMENGQVNVTLNTLIVLADALQIAAYELVKGEYSMSDEPGEKEEGHEQAPAEETNKEQEQ